VEEQEKWILLRSADYLVFLSRWDGPPRPVREALSVGTPVIVSHETNMGEVVEECQAGLVVNLNSDQIAEAFMKLTQEPALRGQFCAGVKKIQERLSWDRIAEDWLCELKRIVT
jgi:glycosyltransferase involved in cell wall biosynthesis